MIQEIAGSTPVLGWIGKSVLLIWMIGGWLLMMWGYSGGDDTPQ